MLGLASTPGPRRQKVEFNFDASVDLVLVIYGHTHRLLCLFTDSYTSAYTTHIVSITTSILLILQAVLQLYKKLIIRLSNAVCADD